MKTILLIVSIGINIVLYFGIVNLGQYRNYVDNSISYGKKIIESPKFQKLKDIQIQNIKTFVNSGTTIK